MGSSLPTTSQATSQSPSSKLPPPFNSFAASLPPAQAAPAGPPAQTGLPLPPSGSAGGPPAVGQGPPGPPPPTAGQAAIPATPNLNQPPPPLKTTAPPPQQKPSGSQQQFPPKMNATYVGQSPLQPPGILSYAGLIEGMGGFRNVSERQTKVCYLQVGGTSNR